MKMKLLVGFLVFLIVINLATIGSFLYFRWHNHPPMDPNSGPGGPGGLGQRLPMLMEQLTPEQREKLGSMVEQFREDTKVSSESLHVREQLLFTLMMRNPLPKDSVYATMEEIGRMRAEMGKRAVDRLIETKQVLTPAQQELFFRAIMSPGRRPEPRGPEEMREGPPFRHGPPPGMRGHRPPPPRDGMPLPPPDDGPPTE